MTLPERPQNIGFPSLFTGYWDPVIEACVETQTVISLHVGSSGGFDLPEGAPGSAMASTAFPALSIAAAREWLFSGIPVRYPTVNIALSEGGIGWVAMMMDRLEGLVDRSGYAEELGWKEHPAEVFRRNFWFCTIDDRSTMDTRHRIGVENILVEVDYPHGDGTWPHTQAVIEEFWGHVPAHELRAMCCENAARLLRHPLPPTVRPL